MVWPSEAWRRSHRKWLDVNERDKEIYFCRMVVDIGKLWVTFKFILYMCLTSDLNERKQDIL